MTQFFPLKITAIHKTIPDAVVVTLAPDATQAKTFTYIQGQYLTFRRTLDGEELRRSYSICSGAEEQTLRVGIKRVEGGIFSTWANEDLKIGDVIDAMPPQGRFHTPLDPAANKNYLAFAAGSGITPVLSILKTTLAREPHASFTLVYANKGVNTIMFREELEDLKNTALGRLSVIHILGNDAQEIELFTGRITEEKCAALFRQWIDIGAIDTTFICGPEPMMKTIAKALGDHGLDKSAIKYELFASAPRRTGRPIRHPATATKTIHATIKLHGSSRQIEMPKEGQSVLEAAKENDLDVPYSCQAGVCSTCRARLIEGQVDMRANHALEDYEIEQGYVLTCQCYPLSDTLVVDYDQ